MKNEENRYEENEMSVIRINTKSKNTRIILDGVDISFGTTKASINIQAGKTPDMTLEVNPAWFKINQVVPIKEL